MVEKIVWIYTLAYFLKVDNSPSTFGEVPHS